MIVLKSINLMTNWVKKKRFLVSVFAPKSKNNFHTDGPVGLYTYGILRFHIVYKNTHCTAEKKGTIYPDPT